MDSHTNHASNLTMAVALTTIFALCPTLTQPACSSRAADELATRFPQGIAYGVAYDPTVFVRDSIGRGGDHPVRGGAAGRGVPALDCGSRVVM